MYIKKTNEFNFNIGDWTETTIRHESFSGIFTTETDVKVIDIDPVRGYSIEDEDGNRMYGIGWTI